jgi:hypothetical protein
VRQEGVEQPAGDAGDEPFRWDEERRARLRAELDAFFFRLYGIEDRADVDYILETFQTETGGLKHNEIKEHGHYRTKDWVLAEYDRMAAAVRNRSTVLTLSDSRNRWPPASMFLTPLPW